MRSARQWACDIVAGVILLETGAASEAGALPWWGIILLCALAFMFIDLREPKHA